MQKHAPILGEKWHIHQQFVSRYGLQKFRRGFFCQSIFKTLPPPKKKRTVKSWRCFSPFHSFPGKMAAGYFTNILSTSGPQLYKACTQNSLTPIFCEWGDRAGKRDLEPPSNLPSTPAKPPPVSPCPLEPPLGFLEGWAVGRGFNREGRVLGGPGLALFWTQVWPFFLVSGKPLFYRRFGPKLSPIRSPIGSNFWPTLSLNFCQAFCATSKNISEPFSGHIRPTSEPHPNHIRTTSELPLINSVQMRGIVTMRLRKVHFSCDFHFLGVIFFRRSCFLGIRLENL